MPPQIIKFKAKFVNENIEVYEKSQPRSIMEIFTKTWNKNVRDCYLSEIFKGYETHQKYFNNLRKILIFQRRNSNIIKFDYVNNLLLVGMEKRLEIWSVRKQKIIKIYDLSKYNGKINSIEIRKQKCIGEYNIWIRFTDWTIINIFDPLVTANNKNYRIMKIYELKGNYGKRYDPSFRIMFLDEGELLLYPKINNEIGIFDTKTCINKTLMKNEESTQFSENEYKFIYNSQCDLIWIYNSVNEILEKIN